MIGATGFVFSVILICGISRKCFKCFVPWICFQLLSISYQVYFSFVVFKSNKYVISSYSSMLILMVFIFHTIFECYYLCLIVGLSQIIANIDAIENRDVQMSSFQRKESIVLVQTKQAVKVARNDL